MSFFFFLMTRQTREVVHGSVAVDCDTFSGNVSLGFHLANVHREYFVKSKKSFYGRTHCSVRTAKSAFKARRNISSLSTLCSGSHSGNLSLLSFGFGASGLSGATVLEKGGGRCESVRVHFYTCVCVCDQTRRLLTSPLGSGPSSAAASCQEAETFVLAKTHTHSLFCTLSLCLSLFLAQSKPFLSEFQISLSLSLSIWRPGFSFITSLCLCLSLSPLTPLHNLSPPSSETDDPASLSALHGFLPTISCRTTSAVAA